jgi:hypothetical protein
MHMGISFRLLRIAALGVATILCIPASAQRWQDHDRGEHRDDFKNSRAYQDGYRDGERDAEHHRRNPHGNQWKSDHDRHAYNAGYDAGFSARERAGGPEQHPGYRGPEIHGGPVTNPQSGPQFGNRGGNQAARIGYEDGMMDGQKDRRTGHSFRPTQGDNYKSATRGYISGFGSRDQYKADYRRAYSEAYQRGYYGR